MYFISLLGSNSTSTSNPCTCTVRTDEFISTAAYGAARCAVTAGYHAPGPAKPGATVGCSSGALTNGAVSDEQRKPGACQIEGKDRTQTEQQAKRGLGKGLIFRYNVSIAGM